MGSKKHKKESKKKKHRSRSRSPLDNGERERKRHKKHKDRKKDRSPDVEEVPVDSHLPTYKESNGVPVPVPVPVPAPRSRSGSVELRQRDRERRQRELHREERHASMEKSYENERPSAASSSGGAQESLSIEETNKLRAKLGLKPLEVVDKPSDDGKIKDDLGEFYHKPASNITQQKKSEKIREKLEERREKRKLDNKLQKTTLLAEGSDDEDAAAWIKKSREIEKQKQEAAKRAAMLDELDAEFGVGALVAADARDQRSTAYTPAHLAGLRVAHDIQHLEEERDTILTLADKEVLAEDAEDVLVNVNMADDERHRKNVEERKKARSGYQAYDDEAEVQAALGLARPLLAKYDDTLKPGQAEKTRGFLIGDQHALRDRMLKDKMRQEIVQGGADKRLETLTLPPLQLARDYMDHEEIEAKFKKPKKKGKIRKKAKHEPIDVEDYDAGNAPLETDDTEVQPTLVQDELEPELDAELQAALQRARRRNQPTASIVKVEEILGSVKEEAVGAGEVDDSGMVLDATAEFCRTLGDIPTYGLAGNRDHHAEIMDLEDNEETEVERSGRSGAWSRVDVKTEAPPEVSDGAGVGLEAEPALGAGAGGALRLALSKGYLERAGAAPQRASHPHRAAHAHLLHAAHYSIEDKTYGEDDKHGRRERGGHSGPLQDFREKNNFRPNIKLEYVDDDGRPLCPKEAFRYLSHKFHGKGPGKNKQEKRIKKAVQEGLMKKMSSTDTPLGTLQMLQDKQRETHSPYVVLSGAKRDHPR